MSRAQKQCAPTTLAGVTGAASTDAGADRPVAPHTGTLRTRPMIGKRVLMFKWHDGALRMVPPANLSALQFALAQSRS